MRAVPIHGVSRTLNDRWRPADARASKPPAQCCSTGKGD